MIAHHSALMGCCDFVQEGKWIQGCRLPGIAEELNCTPPFGNLDQDSHCVKLSCGGYCPSDGFSWEEATAGPGDVISYSRYSMVRNAVPKTRTLVSLSFDSGNQKSPIF